MPNDEILQVNETLNIEGLEDVSFADKNRINSKEELSRLIEEYEQYNTEAWNNLTDLLKQYVSIDVTTKSSDEDIKREQDLFNNILTVAETLANQEEKDYKENDTDPKRLSDAKFIFSWFEGRARGYLPVNPKELEEAKKKGVTSTEEYGTNENEKKLKGRMLYLKDSEFDTNDEFSFEKQENGILFPHDPCMADIWQGALGDCYLLSTLGSISNFNPEKIKEGITDNRDGTVTVRFFEKPNGDLDFSEGRPIYVTVDKSIPKRTSSEGIQKDVYGNKCLWVQMVEKAYAASGMHVPKTSKDKTTTVRTHAERPTIKKVYKDYAILVNKALIKKYLDQQAMDEMEAYLKEDKMALPEHYTEIIINKAIKAGKKPKEIEKLKKEIDKVIDSVTKPSKEKYPWLYDNEGKVRTWKPKYGGIASGIESYFMSAFMGADMGAHDIALHSAYARFQRGLPSSALSKIPDSVKAVKNTLGKENEKLFENDNYLNVLKEMKKLSMPPEPKTAEFSKAFARLNVLCRKIVALGDKNGLDDKTTESLKNIQKRCDVKDKNYTGDENVFKEFRDLIKPLADAEKTKDGKKGPVGKAIDEFDSILKHGTKHFFRDLTEQAENYSKYTDAVKNGFVTECCKDYVMQKYERYIRINRSKDSPIEKYNKAVKVETFFSNHIGEENYDAALAYFVINGKLPKVDDMGNISKNDKDFDSFVKNYDSFILETAKMVQKGKIDGKERLFINNISTQTSVQEVSNFFRGIRGNVSNIVSDEIGSYTNADAELFEKLTFMTRPDNGKGKFLVTAGTRKTNGAEADTLAGVPGGHAYAVLGTCQRKINGKTYAFVKLRNPHNNIGREYFINSDNKLEGRIMDESKGNTQKGYFEMELSEFSKCFDSLSVAGGPDYNKKLETCELNNGTSKITAEYRMIMNDFCEMLSGTKATFSWDTDAFKQMIKETDKVRRELMSSRMKNPTAEDIKNLFETLETKANNYLTTHADKSRNDRMEKRFQIADAIKRFCASAKNPEKYSTPRENLKENMAAHIADKMTEGYVMEQTDFKAKDRVALIEKYKNAAKNILKLDNVKSSMEDYTPEQLLRFAVYKSHKELKNIVLDSYIAPPKAQKGENEKENDKVAENVKTEVKQENPVNTIQNPV